MIPASPLRLQRLRSGLSLVDVYVEIRLEPSKLSRIERGVLAPRADELEALERLYARTNHTERVSA